MGHSNGSGRCTATSHSAEHGRQSTDPSELRTTSFRQYNTTYPTIHRESIGNTSTRRQPSEQNVNWYTSFIKPGHKLQRIGLYNNIFAWTLISFNTLNSIDLLNQGRKHQSNYRGSYFINFKIQTRSCKILELKWIIIQWVYEKYGGYTAANWIGIRQKPTMGCPQ